jgi:hypothetical protein
MNIYEKLVDIRSNIKSLNKDTSTGNEKYGYSYVSGSQILKLIKEKMDEHKVLLVPEIDYSTFHWEKHEYTTSKGNEKLDFIVTAKMTYTWLNAEDPQDKIVCPWVCVGQQTDDISKAMGTALTYNERYFLLKFLGIPTDEDDADKKEPTGAHNATSKKGLSEPQIKRAYVIASKAGYNSESLNGLVLKKYNKPLAQLTREEYDHICNSLEEK